MLGAFGREGLAPIHIIEDGLDAETTARFEQLREFTGVAPARQIYGYGGYLVSRSWRNPLTRDKVAAVYKLSSTCGEPRMKFGNEGGLGKVSIPGDPVAWRRLRGDGPLSVIGQHGETPPEDYVVLSGNDAAAEQLPHSSDGGLRSVELGDGPLEERLEALGGEPVALPRPAPTLAPHLVIACRFRAVVIQARHVPRSNSGLPGPHQSR